MQSDTMPAAQAVEALVADYGTLVFHVILGLTGDWQESQDLTQDTFLQALQALDAARAASGANFHAKAWLLRIAINTTRMQQRRRSLMRFIPFSRLRQAQREEDDTDLLAEAMAPVQPAGYGTPEAGDPAEVVAEQEAIQRTLVQLPETLRTPLLLSIVSGLSSTEIAALLEVGKAAVRQRLSRARQQFRHIYTAQIGDVLVDEATTRGVRRAPVPAQGVPLSMTA